MKYILLSGRVFLSLIFIKAIFFHVTQDAINYGAAKNVPFAAFSVPLAGVIALLGGLSIALGFRAKIGAWLIASFLVPVMFFMHDFWNITDPGLAANQSSHFFKNLSMLGGALIVAFFGAGPLSIDHMLGHKQKTNEDLNRILSQMKGMHPEDTKDKIKVNALKQKTQEVSLQNFWQNPEDPNEVILIFKNIHSPESNLIIKKYSLKNKDHVRILAEADLLKNFHPTIN